MTDYVQVKITVWLRANRLFSTTGCKTFRWFDSQARLPHFAGRLTNPSPRYVHSAMPQVRSIKDKHSFHKPNSNQRRHYAHMLNLCTPGVYPAQPELNILELRSTHHTEWESFSHRGSYHSALLESEPHFTCHTVQGPLSITTSTGVNADLWEVQALLGSGKHQCDITDVTVVKPNIAAACSAG